MFFRSLHKKRLPEAELQRKEQKKLLNTEAHLWFNPPPKKKKACDHKKKTAFYFWRQ